MYVLREYARTATTEANSNRNIHENIFLQVLCISNYTLLFSALCPVRWTQSIIRFGASNKAHVVVNIDSEGLGGLF